MLVSSSGSVRTKSRVMLVLVLASLCFCVLASSSHVPTASAKGLSLNEAWEKFLKKLETDPTLSKFPEYSAADQEAVERSLGSEQWLQKVYNAPSYNGTKTLIESELPEAAANDAEAFAEEAAKGITEIPSYGPEEELIGKDLLEAAEVGKVIPAAAGGVVALAASLGWLTYEDITTGTNPINSFVVSTFFPDQSEKVDESAGVGGATIEAERWHDVGLHAPTLTELFGKNEEELGGCAQPGMQCLETLFPWQFEHSEKPSTNCAFSEVECPLFKLSEVGEGQKDILEVKVNGHWLLETWGLQTVGIRDYPSGEHEESLLGTSFKLKPKCDSLGSSWYIFDWPEGRPGELHEAPPGPGHEWVCQKEKIGEAPAKQYALRGRRLEVTKPLPTHIFVSLPHSASHHATETEEPDPWEGLKKSIEKLKEEKEKGYFPHFEPEWEHRTNGAPPVKGRLPTCSTSMSGAACVELYEHAGFTHVELDPLTWETAIVTQSAGSFVSSDPETGTEANPEEEVKVVANPAIMPAIVPSPAHENELGTDFQTELEEKGWTDTEISVLPETLIDTSVGPSDVSRTSPRAGTRVAPGTEGSTKVAIVVNPATAPPPEHHEGIGGPDLPGFKLPSFPILCKGFPFGVPCWLAKTIESWSTTAVAPVWGFSFTIKGKEIKGSFDFAKLENVMEKVRAAILIFATIGLVLLFYSFAKGGGPPSGSGGGGQSYSEEQGEFISGG